MYGEYITANFNVLITQYKPHFNDRSHLADLATKIPQLTMQAPPTYM